MSALVRRQPCIVCGGTEFAERVKLASARVTECRTCGLAWTNPPESVSTASYHGKPKLAKGYAEVEARGFEYALNVIRVLQRHLRSGRVLDVGCSVGTLVSASASAGFDADGLDLDHTAVEIGKRMGRRLAAAPLTEWPCTSYDAILLQHTLEHVREPAAFLSECRRHLKHDGRILIVVPCHDGLHPRMFGSRWYGWQPAQHYFHYSRQSLSTILNSAGFEIQEIFQNSMDHRLERKYMRGLKAIVKILCMAAVAALGACIGKGDQLVAVACVGRHQREVVPQ